MIINCSNNTSIVERELNFKIWRRVKEYLVTVNMIILSDQDVLCLRIQKKYAGTSIDPKRLLVRNTEILRLKGGGGAGRGGDASLVQKLSLRNYQTINFISVSRKILIWFMTCRGL